ncbi:hypothetical protein JVU11DRAFT_3180 [Chiua virens]|nr:hypothetical protein JVU11DRAFT_3180 [Chiua virens]
MCNDSDNADCVDDVADVFRNGPADRATEDGLAVMLVERTFICLPSVISLELCKSADVDDLIQQEIQLRIGQANDALHELQLSLVDKAILFLTRVWNSKSQHSKGYAWDKVTSVQNIVHCHGAMYCCMRTQLEQLGANQNTMSPYPLLLNADLKVMWAVADPNAHGQRNSTLPWFWSTNILCNTEVDNWMLECVSIITSS